MEIAEVEKNASAEEGTNQLNRNRSFKSKQLVRSQAIRETASPPRAASPAPAAAQTENVDNSDHSKCNDDKKLPVEIQITSGVWEETQCEQRQRRRWTSETSRDLLSNNPRIACVCGACACPNCRGRRRRHACPTKQDSGIVCSEDCPDCSDVDNGGTNNNEVTKKASLEVDDQMYYCRCPDRRDKPKNMTLTRNDSGDYQKYDRNELSGPELVAFLKDTLNKNPRDRMALLKIEKELHSLINDTGRCIVRFPVMTSYGRMLVHRCASLFQLSHHLDHANKTAVLVSKSGTCGGRIPCTSFKEWCTATFPPSPQRHQTDTQHAKSILKRDTHSLDESGAGALACNRSKSLEQREREYERVRRRIFSSQDEAQWPWLTSGTVKVLTPEGGRNKLLKVQSLEGNGGQPSSNNWRGRGAVSKSHSFGGYTGAEPQPQPRLLSRQGDLASSSWRLSPSSSGYKTLSLRSTDSITPSPTGGASPEPSGAMSGSSGAEGAVVWAVTDMSAVPPGALVIHPQTGRALTNPDGTVYHFDPANPPVLYDPGIVQNEHQQQLDQNNEKRRGRLEKQHSFMDHECECQPSEECRNKCCCECRRHEACHQKPADKELNVQLATNPPTPIEQPSHTNQQPTQTETKQTYDTNKQKTETTETTNDRNANEPTTNCRDAYEPSTTNDRIAYETVTTNNRNTYEPTTTNDRHVYENSTTNDPNVYETQTTNNRHVYETPATNGRNVYEQTTNECNAYENCTTNEIQKTTDMINQRSPNEVMKVKETQELHYQQYPQYRTEEVTSPQQIQNHYIHQDVTLQQVMQNKMTPVPIQDPNIRPMSLTNVIYPGAVAQAYPYQVRVDQPMVYQQIVQPEEQKLAPSPHTNETAFRIDPSYPYAAVDYAGAGCGACVDTSAIQHQRSYSVPYSQVEVPQVLPAHYPVGNVLLPQPHLQHYPYQESLPWAQVAQAPKLVVPEIYPTMVPYPQPTYPHYNIMYPQVIPQPYPICQPIYPIIDTKPQERRNSIPRTKRNSISNSSRNTPDKAAYDEQARQAEIAAKIQQIKSQMAQLNVKEKRPERTERERTDWKEGRRRNSGNGILGNCPVNNFNGRVMGRTHDDTHLSSAARAIVNSIRNMQAKNNTYQEHRREYQRFDNKDRRRLDRDDKDTPSAGQSTGHTGQSSGQDRYDVRNRVPNVPIYRQPYLFRQMSPGTWCRRSPGPVHPVLNPPRRPHPDGRNSRR